MDFLGQQQQALFDQNPSLMDDAISFRTDYGQDEVKQRDGKDPRKYAVMTKEFIGDDAGNVKAIKIVSLKVARDDKGRPSLAEIEGSEQVIECDAVILAMGFTGPEPALVKDFALDTTPQSNIKAMHGSNGEGYTTSVEGVFSAGDCRRGQSLVVWAINEGQRAADAVNRYLLETRAKRALNAVKDGVQSGRSAVGRRFSTSALDQPKD